MNYMGLGVEIKEVQKIQLEILLELDRICKKYDIKYQLYGGTLLGAIRHKGFIPWDDDIDVCLLREDYNKLIKACEKDLDTKYFLQNYETDENSILHFSKMRKNNTIFRSASYKESEMHVGIFIDIFPMDNIYPDTVLGNLHIMLTRIMFVLTSSRIKSRCYYAQNALRRVSRLMLYYILKIFPKKSIDRLATKTFTMFNSKETEYVSDLTNGVTRKAAKQYMQRREDFYDTIDGEFEGHLFPIPRDYHDVLTRMYGDYMEFPPESERYPHHGIIEVNLNTKE